MSPFIGFYVTNALLFGLLLALVDFMHRNDPKHNAAPRWLHLAVAVAWPLVCALSLFLMVRRFASLMWRGRPDVEGQDQKQE